MTSRASGLLVNNESDNDLVLIPCTGTEKANANSQDVRGNPTDRGAWWVTVHRVTKSQTWLKQHTHTASLAWMGYSPQGHKESDMTEATHTNTHTHTASLVAQLLKSSLAWMGYSPQGHKESDMTEATHTHTHTHTHTNTHTHGLQSTGSQRVRHDWSNTHTHTHTHTHSVPGGSVAKEFPGLDGLQSTGSQRVRHDWSNTHTASLVAQLLKSYRQCRKLPAMQETWVWSLAWEDPLEEGMATHFSIPVCRIPQTRGAWWATFHGVTRVRHNLVTKPPPSRLAIISLVKRDKKIKLSVPK